MLLGRKEVAKAVQVLWTSALKMTGAGEHERELSFILNQILRDDSKELVALVAPIVRSVNLLTVVRMQMTAVKFPAQGVLYRGGGMPDEHLGFFKEGKVFRVAGFLSSSVEERVAHEFMAMYRTEPYNYPVVKFIIRLDPRGEKDAVYRCQHVNYVEKSNVEAEKEYLFAPYSPFKVIKVHRGTGSMTNHHVIELEAGLDSKDFPEDLPLAQWI